MRLVVQDFSIVIVVPTGSRSGCLVVIGSEQQRQKRWEWRLEKGPNNRWGAEAVPASGGQLLT